MRDFFCPLVISPMLLSTITVETCLASSPLVILRVKKTRVANVINELKFILPDFFGFFQKLSPEPEITSDLSIPPPPHYSLFPGHQAGEAAVHQRSLRLPEIAAEAGDYSCEAGGADTASD